MSLRTRLAFMAILSLVGWVLASPHIKRVAKSGKSPLEALPLLRLQRQPSTKIVRDPILDLTKQTQATDKVIQPPQVAMETPQPPVGNHVSAKPHTDVATQQSRYDEVTAATDPPSDHFGVAFGSLSQTEQLDSRQLDLQSVTKPIARLAVRPATFDQRDGNRSKSAMRPMSSQGRRSRWQSNLAPVGPSQAPSEAREAPRNAFGDAAADRDRFVSDATSEPRRFLTPKSQGTVRSNREPERTQRALKPVPLEPSLNSPKPLRPVPWTPPTTSNRWNLRARTQPRETFIRKETRTRERPQSLKSGVQYHRITQGDSLVQLAQKYLGNPDLAMRLFEANRDKLIAPDILPLGVDLVIPQRNRRSGRR